MNETSTAISFLDQLIVPLLKQALGRVNSQLRTMVAESTSVQGHHLHRDEVRGDGDAEREVGGTLASEYHNGHHLSGGWEHWTMPTNGVSSIGM